MSTTRIPAALRRLVRARAQDSCEYCLIPEIASFATHEIDHVVAEKHGGETVEGNLALACNPCNKHKGSDLSSIDPETGEIVRLYQPRRDIWQEHFRLEDGAIIPITDKRATSLMGTCGFQVKYLAIDQFVAVVAAVGGGQKFLNTERFLLGGWGECRSHGSPELGWLV